GGDITRGSQLCIAVQAHGFVDAGQALHRGGAAPGDLVYVTGALGAAGMGLRLATGQVDGQAFDEEARRGFEDAYYRPQPRVAFGRALVGLASAAIDISDGLLADLGHVARRSGMHVRVRARDIPLATGLEAV